MIIEPVVSVEGVTAASGPYSHAVRVGSFVWTSGQLPLAPDGRLVEGGIEQQTRQVMENLSAVLKAAGTSLDRVVKTTVFLKDLSLFAAFNEVYASYFPDRKPARSTVEVARLPRDVLVEIEAVAVV